MSMDIHVNSQNILDLCVNLWIYAYVHIEFCSITHPKCFFFIFKACTRIPWKMRCQYSVPTDIHGFPRTIIEYTDIHGNLREGLSLFELKQ